MRRLPIQVRAQNARHFYFFVYPVWVMREMRGCLFWNRGAIGLMAAFTVVARKRAVPLTEQEALS